MNDTTNPPVKRCSKCGELKPFEMFSKGKAKDGLQTTCKACVNAYHKKRADEVNAKRRAERLENPERFREQSRTDYIKHREKRLDYQVRYKAEYPEKIIAYKKDLYARTKSEDNAKSKAWRELNLEYARAVSRQYYRDHSIQVIANTKKWSQANPDRITSRRQTRRTLIVGNGGSFTETDIAHMRAIQQGHCCYCGRMGQKLSVDHIIPVNQRGPSDPWNLALCCKSCNSSKNDRTLEQWVNRWYLPTIH